MTKPSTARHPRINPNCETCKGKGWVQATHYHFAVKCPTCFPAGYRAAQRQEKK